jgi:glyoxylase-like metal-dependent hydrolase (beta-lactamase superfamily II)
MIEYKMKDTNLLLLRLELGEIGTNCYLVADKASKELAVIDPAAEFDVLWAAIEQTGCTVKYIFNTHGHWDHIGANKALHDKTGAPILIHAEDAPRLKQGYDSNFSVRVPASEADELLEEGQVWALGAYKLRILHTPGHTKGGVAIVLSGEDGDRMVFSGDSLFQLSIGRTDLPGGDYEELLTSIRRKLFTLDDGVAVFPGHGAHTFIGDEKKYNPFLK